MEDLITELQSLLGRQYGPFVPLEEHPFKHLPFFGLHAMLAHLLAQLRVHFGPYEPYSQPDQYVKSFLSVRLMYTLTGKLHM